MLHIILNLLKIIGIVLLILLGILLFLVIAVLAAPVQYEFSGGWDKAPHLNGRISWLYRILGVSFSMKNGRVRTRIMLFGHARGSKVAAEKAVEAERGQPDTGSEDLTGPDSEVVSEPEDLTGPDSEVVSEPEAMPEPETQQKPVSAAGGMENPEQAVIEEFFSGSESEDDDTGEEYFEETFEEKDDSVLSLIRRILDFINLPSVRRLLGKLRKSIRRIIRHLLPSRLLLRAKIGTDNPALTGKIMELAAVLYAFYGDSIEVVSDFDEKVLKAAVSVKGRLVPGYLIVKILGMALRILLNRECRALYRDIKENLT